jgi:hypothetical protein
MAEQERLQAELEALAAQGVFRRSAKREKVFSWISTDCKLAWELGLLKLKATSNDCHCQY